MNAPHESQTATRFFSRVLGPFLIIFDVTAVARASDMQSLLSQFEANSMWTFVTGAFILLLGLTIVAAHQIWRGAAAIIVSLLGWLIVLRGLLLVAFPKFFASLANDMIGAQGWWITACIVFALVGVYLTYVGWAPAPTRPTSQAAATNPDLPRAA
jgi:vacuolar-type H+-ATPase subunit I/STV1